MGTCLRSAEGKGFPRSGGNVMKISSSVWRRALLAGACGGLLVVGASAQQSSESTVPGAVPGVAPAPVVVAAPAAPVAPALPPGSPLIGRPKNNAAAAKLGPVVPPPIATAADKLPTARLKLPPGFNIEVYAAGMTN